MAATCAESESRPLTAPRMLDSVVGDATWRPLAGIRCGISVRDRGCNRGVVDVQSRSSPDLVLRRASDAELKATLACVPGVADHEHAGWHVRGLRQSRTTSGVRRRLRHRLGVPRTDRGNARGYTHRLEFQLRMTKVHLHDRGRSSTVKRQYSVEASLIENLVVIGVRLTRAR